MDCMKLGLSTLTFLALICGCRTLESSSDLTRVQPEEPKVGRSKLTAARVMALNDWALKLLEETKDLDDFQTMTDNSFAKMGIAEAEPLKRYSINLRPGNECFRDSTPGHSLWWARHRDQIARQIESAAHFLFVYHQMVYGRPKGPFGLKEIEICPKSTVKADLSYLGGKLIIGVPYSLVQGYRPWTSDELLKKWRRGEHLTQEGDHFNSFFTKTKLQKIWTLFDPIGAVRLSLRQGFQDRAQGLLETLKTQQEKATLQSWKQVLWGRVVDPQRLRYSHDQALERLWAENKSGLLLKNWRCLAQNPVTSDDLSWSALSIVDQSMTSRDSQVDVTIKAGLVAVGNYHQIGVRFTLSQGAYEEYMPISLMTQKPSASQVKAHVEGGLVAVFTIDDINIDVAVKLLGQMVPKSLETATFDRAVLATMDGKTLCPM